MGIYLVPKFHLIVFAYIISVLACRNGVALAGTEPEASEKFTMVKTPDKNEESNLLLVGKKDGLKSLIKIEERTEGIIKTADNSYVKLE